ncbi:MAG: glycosyltransferase [Deltaproteobacteria bacterium]|nr:glycosyltransferase [Deltaproteobacteria bacterium]
MKTNNEYRPEVSVVMPVFNGEKYLNEAVDSILDQRFKDFEFIIINDGSVDNTSKILDSYSDGRIRLVQRENRGFAYSLNEAIQLAEGKYIARMDADDVALENRLRLQYEFMESHSGVDILGGQADIIDEYGRLIGEMRKPASWPNISKYIKYACPLCHPTYFVREHVYDIIKGYRNIPPVEDYDFLFRAFEKGCVMRNLPEKILKYRKTNNSMTANNFLRTVTLTSQVQKLHVLRVNSTGSIDRIDSINYVLKKYNKKPNFWFNFVYNSRNKLLAIRKRQKGLKKYLLFVSIIVVSLGNYHIFQNTYKGFKSLRWNK